MFQFPWSASTLPMYSVMSDWLLHQPGFPIRTSPDQSLLTAPRGLIVVRHVLLRLLVPRHPPCALSSLTKCSCFWLTALLLAQRIEYLKTFAVQLTSIKLVLTQVLAKRMFSFANLFRYPVFKDQWFQYWDEHNSCRSILNLSLRA
jgi:hypothetical protein